MTKERTLFGHNARTIRKARGIPLVKMAELLECTQPAVTGWENGRNEPAYCTLIKLADILAISIDELLGRKPIDMDALRSNPAGSTSPAGCVECARKDAVIAEQKSLIGNLIDRLTR